VIQFSPFTSGSIARLDTGIRRYDEVLLFYREAKEYFLLLLAGAEFLSSPVFHGGGVGEAGGGGVLRVKAKGE